jgi:hypothetical protein
MEKLGSILERVLGAKAPSEKAGAPAQGWGNWVEACLEATEGRRATLRVGPDQFDAAAEALRGLPLAVRGRIRLVLKPQLLSPRGGKTHSV